MTAGAHVIIPAAGKSSRFNGGIKPLHEVGGIPMLERVVRLYQGVGMTPLVVVRRESNLVSILDSLGVTPVVNEDESGDMLTSIKVGLDAIPDDTSAIFIHPCDIPVVLPGTVVRLFKRLKASGTPAICPSFKGKTGHPLCLSSELRQRILRTESGGGLRGVLDTLEVQVAPFPTDDEGTTMDVDVVEDVDRVESLLARRASGNGCTLYLMRHGQIEQREPRRFIGQRDIPLDAVGRQQITQAAQMMRGIEFEAVYSSPLSRCMETAQGIIAGRGLVCEPVDRLREISLGDWEDLTVDEVRQRFPGEYEQRGESLADFRPSGGENFHDVQQRGLRVLSKIASRHTGNVLVVAHTGFNRAVLTSILELELSDIMKMPQDYCCLNVLGWRDNAWDVLMMNSSNAGPG